jgi:hypothetical protein
MKSLLREAVGPGSGVPQGGEGLDVLHHAGLLVISLLGEKAVVLDGVFIGGRSTAILCEKTTGCSEKDEQKNDCEFHEVHVFQ